MGEKTGLLEEIERNGQQENFLDLVSLDLRLVQHLPGGLLSMGSHRVRHD